MKVTPVGRTLPREILKWLQGLDLSYSVRDSHKDLSNGFLIAEIFSRYYPGRVSMHSFDNSHNVERRVNNYRQLELFFKKNDINLQGYQPLKTEIETLHARMVSDKSYKPYQPQQDQEWELLYAFIVQIYSFLTTRKVINPPLANYVNSKEFASSTQQTQTYLLKEKGIEKLQEEQKVEEKELSEKHAPLSVSSKRTNFMRIPSKPISQNIENLNYQIDVKNIQIRPVQGSLIKLKEEHNEKTDKLVSNNDRQIQDSFQKTPLDDNKREIQTNREKQIDKSIYDILNESLILRQQMPQFVNEVQFQKDVHPLQSFVDRIEVFSEEFVSGFFQEIVGQRDAYINFIFKDTNEIWKFFSFLLQCIQNLPIERVGIVVELVVQFGSKALQKDALKTRSLFLEFFLPEICGMMKSSVYFEKKHYLMSIVQAFQEVQFKHQIISIMKLNLTVEHFMQCLAVFSASEPEQSDLWPDILNYGYRYMVSQSPSLSSCAIAILANAARFGLAKVDKYVLQLARNSWWQNRCLTIVLLSQLIRQVIKTPNYQNLIKNPQQGQKFFSIENDRIISDLKAQVTNYAKGIEIACYPLTSDILTSTALIYIVDLLGDSRVLLDLFTKIMLEVPEEIRQWALFSEEQGEFFEFVIPSDKSFKFRTTINSPIIKLQSFPILLTLIDKIKTDKLLSLPKGHFQLLHWCFQNSDFKIQNMESCEAIANISKEYVYLGLCDPTVLHEAIDLARQLLDLQFKSEVQIQDNDKLLAQCINLALKTESDEVIHNLILFLDQLIDDSLVSGSEALKKQNQLQISFMRNVQDNLEQMTPSPLELNPDMQRLFERLGDSQRAIPKDMELSAVQVQNDEQQSDYQY